jgi:hypothetical protein
MPHETVINRRADDVTAFSDPTPRLNRPGVDVVAVDEWIVGRAAQQRAIADAIVADWVGAAWPDGLLSLSALVSTDGAKVLTYAQWTSEESHRLFRQATPSRGASREGVEHLEPVTYRLYRFGARESAPLPGCIVIVSVEFDGPDQQRQKQWVDTVFAALDAETEPHPGGISGYFHISTDGTRVLNYAEWTSEAAHRDALERSGQGAVGLGPKWQEVRTFPGVKSNGMSRYHLHRSLAKP